MIERTIEVWGRYFSEISEGSISQETIDLANDLRAVAGHNYFFANSTALPRRPHQNDIHYTIKNSIGTIKCPVLFQFGEDDIIVNTNNSVEFIPDLPHFKLVIYKETDHSMNLENGDVHPRFIDEKTDWLKENRIIH